MNAILLVAAMTARQLLGQRRTIIVVLLNAVPVVVALIVRTVDADDTAAQLVANPVLEWTTLFMLPLTALILATAALGGEIEDGTAVYLLSKPIARWRILAGKLLAAWGATAVAVLAGAALAGTVTLAGESGWNVLGGYLVALLAGTFAYCALFLMLSLLTSRALLAGIAYVFIWESVITSFAPGVQRASIREYTLGVADLVSGAPANVIDADLGGVLSLILMAAVSAIAVGVAARRLARFELSGEA